MEEEKKVLKNEWEVSAFDREKNEWTTTVNHSWEVQPDGKSLEELLVRRAPESTIRPLGRRAIRKSVEKQVLVGGDLQAPFGDEGSSKLFLRAARELQPADVALVGDMVDLTMLSRWPGRKEWVGNTQQGIDSYYSFLAELRANTPNSRITVVHGNHEQRLVNSLERNMNELSGLRRAMGDKALLSIQYLARYEDLDIEFVDGYPNGTFWLEDNLKFVHGTNVKKGGSNAAKYLQEERETTIYGHTHRQEVAYRTYATKIGGTTIAAASPGALCRTDGTTPGFHYSPTAEGEIVKKAEDWQQGALVINHEGLHHDIMPILFTDRGMLLEGRRYGREA